MTNISYLIPINFLLWHLYIPVFFSKVNHFQVFHSISYFILKRIPFAVENYKIPMENILTYSCTFSSYNSNNSKSWIFSRSMYGMNKQIHIHVYVQYILEQHIK